MYNYHEEVRVSLFVLKTTVCTAKGITNRPAVPSVMSSLTGPITPFSSVYRPNKNPHTALQLSTQLRHRTILPAAFAPLNHSVFLFH
jgi:hypothetical protein